MSSREKETQPNAPLRACFICGRQTNDLVPAPLVRHAVRKMIIAEHPNWSAAAVICQDDLNIYRSKYVENVLEAERGDLTHLEEDVVRSLREQELISQNMNAEFDQRATLGERLADHIAVFGGSWAFLTLFAIVMAVWITINTVHIFSKPFDPFPYILLNLGLSCLAAIQAPVIMMSQNRQESKDRLRSEHDYQVNLKAELEIRQLHAKLDLLLTHQWQRLLEIQEIQLDLMQELRRDSRQP